MTGNRVNVVHITHTVKVEGSIPARHVPQENFPSQDGPSASTAGPASTQWGLVSVVGCAGQVAGPANWQWLVPLVQRIPFQVVRDGIAVRGVPQGRTLGPVQHTAPRVSPASLEQLPGLGVLHVQQILTLTRFSIQVKKLVFIFF